MLQELIIYLSGLAEVRQSLCRLRGFWQRISQVAEAAGLPLQEVKVPTKGVDVSCGFHTYTL